MRAPEVVSGGANLEETRRFEIPVAKKARKEEFRRMERGLVLGDESFRRELWDQMSSAPSAGNYGDAVQEAVRTEKLVAQG